MTDSPGASEARDDAVQHGADEGERLPALAIAALAGAQRPKVLRGPRYGVGEQLEGEPQDRAGAADRDVEVHNRVGHDAGECARVPRHSAGGMA